jgi:hypothetical protein
MQRTATAGKQDRGILRIEGWGHHNLLFIKDYATNEEIFRAETEIRLTPDNKADFARLKVLLDGSLGSAAVNEIVDILHRQVDAAPVDPKSADSGEGKSRAKKIFSAAFGLPPKGN